MSWGWILGGAAVAIGAYVGYRILVKGEAAADVFPFMAPEGGLAANGGDSESQYAANTLHDASGDVPK